MQLAEFRGNQVMGSAASNIVIRLPQHPFESEEESYCRVSDENLFILSPLSCRGPSPTDFFKVKTNSKKIT